jgi:hypothetical protein
MPFTDLKRTNARHSTSIIPTTGVGFTADEAGWSRVGQFDLQYAFATAVETNGPAVRMDVKVPIGNLNRRIFCRAARLTIAPDGAANTFKDIDNVGQLEFSINGVTKGTLPMDTSGRTVPVQMFAAGAALPANYPVTASLSFAMPAGSPYNDATATNTNTPAGGSAILVTCTRLDGTASLLYLPQTLELDVLCDSITYTLKRYNSRSVSSGGETILFALAVMTLL